jgi:hypothetical protein
MKMIRKNQLPALPEKIIQSQVQRMLLLHGFQVLRFNSGAMKMGTRYVKFYEWKKTISSVPVSSGVPDLYVQKRTDKGSCAFWIEVKTEKGVVSEAQKRWAEHSALPVFLVRRLEDVPAIIVEMNRELGK